MDHYGTLGLRRDCSLEQVTTQRQFNEITSLFFISFFFIDDIPLSWFLAIQVLVAYKSNAEELRNQGLDEEELDKKLELLRVRN